MTKNLNNKVIAVVGPTASGKTEFAIDLAKKIGGEIISADSRLVYKGFDIGTAKPTKAEQRTIPHYMIDIVEPEIEYSVGTYVKEAKKIIADIQDRGKIPIVAGGTGLYINALLMNYDFPEAQPNYKLRKELKDNDNIYEILSTLDAKTAETIDKNDRKRIIRAIEIIKATGEKISRNKKAKEFDIEWIGKNFERKELYERINKRVDLMFENGLIEETSNLLKKHGRIPNLISTIGYQEIIEYLDGDLTLSEAIDKLKQNTRRYAKRQLTWFRKNHEINWDVYPETLQK